MEDTTNSYTGKCGASACEGSTCTTPTAGDIPTNVRWSSVIKGVHQTLREVVVGETSEMSKKVPPSARRCGGGKEPKRGGKREREGTEDQTPPQQESANSNNVSSSAVDMAQQRSESYQRWRAFKTDNAGQLMEYADSMRNLAVQYWDGTRGSHAVGAEAANALVHGEAGAGSPAAVTFSQRTGKYDDRVGDVVGLIVDYFLGDLVIKGAIEGPSSATGNAMAQDGVDAGAVCNTAFKKLPALVAMDLRKTRKQYFLDHGTTLPPTLEDERIQASILASGTVAGGRSSKGLTCALWGFLSALPTMPPADSLTVPELVLSLDVLDVGSCYGPFQQMVERLPPLPFHIRLEPRVTSLDLCPYEGSSVTKCDWLEVPFDGDQHRGAASVVAASEIPLEGVVETPTPSSHQSPVSSLPSLPVSSFSLREFSQDVTIFCLLLSFMPTREMRFRSCVNAFRALREDGLLVIVSTKTQGSRDVMSSWVRGWKACIESIGFKAVHQVIKSKLVYLSFRRGTLVVTQSSTTGELNEKSTPESKPPAPHTSCCWSDPLVRERYHHNFEAFYEEVYLPIFNQLPVDAMGLNNDVV